MGEVQVQVYVSIVVFIILDRIGNEHEGHITLMDMLNFILLSL